MKFLRCTVGVKEYGPGCMSDAGEVLPRQAFARGLPAPRAQYTFEDNRLLHDLTVPAANKADHESAAEMRAVDEYLTLLATCHTVMLSYDGCDAAHVHNREGCTARTRFNAQSPDELALVEFAQEQQYFFHHIEPCKFDFRGRTIQGSRLWLNIRGEQHAFDVLEVLEFNSTRKRCSVVLYDNRDGQVKIYCKGADNVIRERLNPDSLATSWLHTNAHLQRFAAIGLRTLCCAYRVVPPEEFLEWHDLMQAAKSSMDGRAEAIASASELIEVGFELLGTTAIEDRLQGTTFARRTPSRSTRRRMSAELRRTVEESRTLIVSFLCLFHPLSVLRIVQRACPRRSRRWLSQASNYGQSHRDV